MRVFTGYLSVATCILPLLIVGCKTSTEEEKCSDADSFECAVDLSAVSTWPYRGSLSSESDLDFGQVTLRRAGVIELQLDESDITTGAGLTLYYKDQQRIEGGFTSSGGRYTTQQLLPAGTYYVKISGGGSKPLDYTLNAGVDSSDTSEMNNDFATATDLVSGFAKPVRIYPDNDVDYLQFKASETGTYQLSISDVPTSLKIRFVISDSQKNLVDDGLVNPGEIGTKNFALTAGATYYVKLTGLSQTGSGIKEPLKVLISKLN